MAGQVRPSVRYALVATLAFAAEVRMTEAHPARRPAVVTRAAASEPPASNSKGALLGALIATCRGISIVSCDQEALARFQEET